MHVPVHFDEAQYWAYGHELAWGHFSKPPLVGWVILAATAFIFAGRASYFVLLNLISNCSAAIARSQG